MTETDIKNPFSGAPVYYIPETGSTMDDGRKLAEEGAADGSVVFAGFQSAGRGRISGRKWFSDPGDNLLCTLVLEEKKRIISPHNLPLIIGLSIASMLKKHCRIDAELKWPNDVLVRGRKISGVLCEARGGYLLAGIGINCNQISFPPELSGSCCSILELIGKKVRPDSLLEDLLFLIYRDLESGDWRKRYESLLYGKGEVISILGGRGDSGKKISGVLSGIGRQGELLLISETTGYTEKIISGEIEFFSR